MERQPVLLDRFSMSFAWHGFNLCFLEVASKLIFIPQNEQDNEGLETWRTAASILLVLVIILFLYLQILVLACLNLSRVNYFFPFLLCFYRHYRNPSVTSLYSQMLSFRSVFICLNLWSKAAAANHLFLLTIDCQGTNLPLSQQSSIDIWT